MVAGEKMCRMVSDDTHCIIRVLARLITHAQARTVTAMGSGRPCSSYLRLRMAKLFVSRKNVGTIMKPAAASRAMRAALLHNERDW